MHDDLVDRIYEAAFVPDLWSDVMEAASALWNPAISSAATPVL
jgi:hypothetical protein